jgi:Clp protease
VPFIAIRSPTAQDLLRSSFSLLFYTVILIPDLLLQDIKLFINSPGGSVTAGMGIYDAMQVLSSLLQSMLACQR